MTFSISEKTVYIKPIKSVSNIYGRDIQLDKSNRDINVDNSLFLPEYGQDRKITKQLPTAQGVPKLYYNLNDRLISSTENNCRFLDSPERIWSREEHSRYQPRSFMNTRDDPRNNTLPDYNFTNVYKRKQ
jgi:hypothetical protein